MDTGTGLVAFVAGQFLAPPVAEFFKHITGKLGDDVGDLLAAHTTYRLRNMAEVVRRAHEKRAGREAAQVPPRLLGPLLNAASLEDDAYLQDRWASLLATAASEKGLQMPPYYISALSQLAPRDARVLDGLDDATCSAQLEPPEKTAGGVPFGLTLHTLRERYGMDDDPAQLSASVDLLIALGLVDREPSLRKDAGYVVITEQEELRLTMLGRDFVAACRTDDPPASA